MGENININVHDSLIVQESKQVTLEEISRYFKKNIRWLSLLAGLGIFNSFSGLIFKGWYSVPVNLGLNAIMFLVGLRAITKVEKIIIG